MFRLLTPLFIFSFGLIVSVYSYITYADFSTYGAAFYPTIIGGAVAFFALLDFVMELKLRNKYVVQIINVKQDIKIIGIMVATVLFYIASVDYLGFILTTSLILLCLTLPLLKKQRIMTAVFLIILAVGIYLLFAKVLQVSLPSGILFE
ncbi:MAG TPA: hypothetical protein DD638_09175 [Pasteurellaceae bacterium]|nr:hypothetical protein [Pasteurellaceae bacterium]